METSTPFTCEVESSPNDQFGNKVTTIKCHGKLTAGGAGELKSVVKPLIPPGGRIVVDMGDVHFVDSSGLGALISLKVSAINHGLCILEFTNLTGPILRLLRITKLEEMLTS